MFRYRQTQHLQNRLEARFADLLKPFGIGTEQASEPVTRKPRRTKSGAASKLRKPAQPKRAKQH